VSKPGAPTHGGSISGKDTGRLEGLASLGSGGHLAGADVQGRGEAVQGQERLGRSFAFGTLF